MHPVAGSGVPARGTWSSLGHPESISKPLALWSPPSSKSRAGVVAPGCLAQSPPAPSLVRVSLLASQGCLGQLRLRRYRVDAHCLPLNSQENLRFSKDLTYTAAPFSHCRACEQFILPTTPRSNETNRSLFFCSAVINGLINTHDIQFPLLCTSSLHCWGLTANSSVTGGGKG